MRYKVGTLTKENTLEFKKLDMAIQNAKALSFFDELTWYVVPIEEDEDGTKVLCNEMIKYKKGFRVIE